MFNWPANAVLSLLPLLCSVEFLNFCQRSWLRKKEILHLSAWHWTEEYTYTPTGLFWSRFKMFPSYLLRKYSTLLSKAIQERAKGGYRARVGWILGGGGGRWQVCPPSLNKQSIFKENSALYSLRPVFSTLWRSICGAFLGWRESKGYAGWSDSKRMRAATLQLATLFQRLTIHLVEKQKRTHIIRRAKFS